MTQTILPPDYLERINNRINGFKTGNVDGPFFQLQMAVHSHPEESETLNDLHAWLFANDLLDDRDEDTAKTINKFINKLDPPPPAPKKKALPAEKKELPEAKKDDTKKAKAAKK